MNNNTADTRTKQTIKRGSFNEILLSSLPPSSRKQVENLVNLASNAEKVDEHGSWDFGAEFDSKSRGSALNWDLYGISRDYHSRKTLIVIQVRQYIKRHKNWYPEIKKSYFLIGRNEDDTVFAHPVPSRTVQTAARAGKDVVRAVQNWIFKIDYTRVIRQGDVSLIPLQSKSVIKKAEEVDTYLVMQDSHILEAETIYESNDNIYAENPNLYHIPRTHPDHIGLEGLYKVVVGRRANFYDFAAPTID